MFKGRAAHDSWDVRKRRRPVPVPNRWSLPRSCGNEPSHTHQLAACVDGVPRVIGRTADRKHAAQLLFVLIIEMMANRLSSALKIVPKSWMEQTPGGFFPPAMQPRAHERASFASLHLTRHDPHGGSELSKDTTKFCASSPNKPPRTSTGHWPAFKALRTAGCRTVLRTALGVRLANLDHSATPAKKIVVT